MRQPTRARRADRCGTLGPVDANALLREADARALDAHYEGLDDARRGRTVFVAGDDAGGRQDLLRGWAQTLHSAKPRPTVLGGRFDGEVYLPWANDAVGAAEHLYELDRTLSVAKAVPLSALGLPPGIDMFLGQILSKGNDLLQAAAALIGARGRKAAPTVVPEALRALCRRGPAVCIVDSVDERAGSLWSELAGLLSNRIATDLPLLLVLGLDGPNDVGEPLADEPEHIAVARSLTVERDVASWHWLAPITAEDLLRWTGPATADLVSWLLELTDGMSGETTRHWRDWQQRRLIENHTERRWRFASRYDPTGDMDGLLNGRVRELTGGGYQAIAGTQRLLGCAALEGRRFTAAAVAVAAERDPDETIAFIDNTLIRDPEHPRGLLTADTPTKVVMGQGIRELAVYRFVRELDWIVMRRCGLSAGERRHRAASLARALEELYGEHADARAITLARLYDLAGNRTRAKHYEQFGTTTDSRIALWRARNALTSPEPPDPIGRHRVAQRLIEGADQLQNAGPFDEGVDLARAAERLAETQEQRANAVYLTGIHLLFSGQLEHARAELTRAKDLCRALSGDTGLSTLGATLAGLAVCDRDQGQIDHAVAGFNAALEITRHLGNRHGEVAILDGLAVCDRLRGQFGDARDKYNAALQISQTIADRAGEASSLLGLAICDREQGHFDDARDGFRTVLQINRDIGNRAWEARALSGLAMCARRAGQIGEAGDSLNAAVQVFRDIADRDGEARAITEFAGCLCDHGDIDGARDGYNTARQMYRGLGDPSGEARAITGLADCDLKQRGTADARDGYNTARRMYAGLGDPIGEARAITGLADCDLKQRDIDGARDGYNSALRMYQDVGDRGGEGVVQRHLEDLK